MSPSGTQAVSAPFVRSGVSVASLEWVRFVAVIPAAVISIFFRGASAALVFALCIASCVLTEFLIALRAKRFVGIQSGRAFLTGILLAFLLPPVCPWWLPALGGCFAVLGEKIFGGFGQSVFHPALLARAFLAWLFPEASGDWMLALSIRPAVFFLNWAFLIGGLFLLHQQVFRWRMPFYYLAGILFLSLARGVDAVREILVTGAVFVAFFYLTDYSGRPLTEKGRAIFALLAAVATVAFRFRPEPWGAATHAILIANAVTPLLDHSLRKSFLARRERLQPIPSLDDAVRAGTDGLRRPGSSDLGQAGTGLPPRGVS